MVQTAKQEGDAKLGPEPYSVVLGKLLAIGIILVPLVMMLFPELNHRSGNTSHGKQDAPAARALTPNPVLGSRALS
jgi:hypothetical protein